MPGFLVFLKFPVAFRIFGVDPHASISCHFVLYVELSFLNPSNSSDVVIFFVSFVGNFDFIVFAFTGSSVDIIASVSISADLVASRTFPLGFPEILPCFSFIPNLLYPL